MSAPPMIYGTAWKASKTASLVSAAISCGFRAIDTACQPKHYFEPGVGVALAACGLPRDALWIQTKYTPIDGQDATKPLPYDPKASLTEQVRQSCATSLTNLQTGYIDSLVLHSPLKSHAETLTVWRAFEGLHAEGKVKALGISNCYDLAAFERLYSDAVIKPTALQNRFYSKSGFDTELRAFCQTRGVKYQSFWTLSANPSLLGSSLLRRLASARKGTVAQVLFKLVMQLGITPLTGTCDETHMKEDLEVLSWPPFSKEDVDAFNALLATSP